MKHVNISILNEPGFNLTHVTFSILNNRQSYKLNQVRMQKINTTVFSTSGKPRTAENCTNQHLVSSKMPIFHHNSKYYWIVIHIQPSFINDIVQLCNPQQCFLIHLNVTCAASYQSESNSTKLSISHRPAMEH